MLQNIRDNSQGWIAKTIIGVIVLLMTFTGFEAIVRSTSNSENAADVNGQKITEASLNAAVEMQRRQLAQQFGRDFDTSLIDQNLLRQGSLDALIEQALLVQSTQAAAMDISEAALDQLILQTPAFQIDGQFNAARFDQVLQQQGMGRLEFRQRLKQDVLISQLQASLAASNFITEQELENFIALDMQTRDFATRTVAAEVNAVELTDAEVDAYYQANSNRFMTPEQVVIEYVELSKADFLSDVEATEEQLQDLYQKEIANLAEQRRAAHILLEVNDQLSDEQAQQQLAQVAERLKQGEDFAVLAKELSQDPGSANEGGDLGFAGPGVYDEGFEQALFALSKGEVSAPVKSAFGWHLIKLLDVQGVDVPSFASLKDKLEAEIKAQQVDQRFVEVVRELEEASYESSDLSQPAQELGLSVKVSAPFGREGGEGIAANRQVLQTAFSEELLEEGSNSGAIELDPETTVVIRVKEHLKPELMPLAAVADSIRNTLAVEKASEAAKSEGERLLAELRSGESGQDWATISGATRAQQDVEPVVLQAVFRMQKPVEGKPTFTGVSLVNGDYVLVRLDAVGQADVDISDEEKLNYRRFLASRAGQQDFAAFRKQLEAQAEIERY